MSYSPTLWKRETSTFRIVGGLVSFIVVALLPYIHIGIVHLHFWVPNKSPINRTRCSCSCFDTVYKGSYESPGHSSYKHIYFNATFQTLMIWIITAGSFILAYEMLKYLYHVFQNGCLRWTMFILVLLDIYPHYYSWWNYFNYFNDDFYTQFYHQMFFCVTEMVSTVLIITMCSKEEKLTSWKILTIISISSLHILIGGLDQFFAQIFLWKGRAFQRIRNLGFIIPDVVHIILPILEFKKSQGVPLTYLFTQSEMFNLACSILVGFVLGKVILR